VPSGNTISVPTVISLSKTTLGVNVIAELSTESIVVPTKVTDPVIAAPEMVIAPSESLLVLIPPAPVNTMTSSVPMSLWVESSAATKN
jgi:hypothetical protein